MRTLLLLPLLVACAETGFAPLAAEDVDEITWRGDFESPDTCSDGAITLDVQRASDDWFEGTYTFDGHDEGLFAMYEVEGFLDGGVLVMDQVDMVDADVLPSWMTWCYGELELALDGEDVMGGSWIPQNCSCSGYVELEPA